MYKFLQALLCVVAIGLSHAKPGFLPGGLHGLAGLAYSAPAAVVAPAPAAVVAAPAVSVSNQYHAQDALGQYSYGYSGDTSAKSESKTADGVTRGGYSYLDSYGLVQSANYVSDPVNGFRVAATNLAKDTPEVVAAKVSHAVAYNEAAAAAAAAPDVPEPVAVVAPAPAVYAAGAPAFAPAVYAAGAPAFAPAVYAAGAPAFAPAVYAAGAPAIAPAVYAAGAPAIAPAVGLYAAGAPAIVSGHAYTAPGIVASANTAGGFSYSAHSVGPAYAPRFYSGVLPGPIAPAPALVNGVPVPVDTPEVASAKAAHYAAHIQEKLRHFG